MSATEAESKIELPEDLNIQLYVLSEAANLAQTEYYTPTVYRNEIQAKQINGLTRLGRDIRTSHEQQMAAEKRERGLVDDVPSSSIVKRPPNFLTIFVILFAALGIVAYGQYSGQLAGWVSGLYTGAVFVVMAFVLVLLLLFVLRRRRKNG